MSSSYWDGMAGPKTQLPAEPFREPGDGTRVVVPENLLAPYDNFIISDFVVAFHAANNSYDDDSINLLLNVEDFCT